MRKTPMIALLTLAQAALLAGCATEGAQPPLEPNLSEPVFMSFANSEWSDPVHLPAPINSPYSELIARLSPDELSIYFGSDRPEPTGA